MLLFYPFLSRGELTQSLPICAGTVQLRHIAIKYEEKTILCVAKRINYVDLFGLVQFQSRTYIAHYNDRDADSP